MFAPTAAEPDWESCWSSNSWWLVLGEHSNTLPPELGQAKGKGCSCPQVKAGGLSLMGNNCSLQRTKKTSGCCPCLACAPQEPSLSVFYRSQNFPHLQGLKTKLGWGIPDQGDEQVVVQPRDGDRIAPGSCPRSSPQKYPAPEGVRSLQQHLLATLLQGVKAAASGYKHHT